MVVPENVNAPLPRGNLEEKILGKDFSVVGSLIIKTNSVN